MEKGELLSVARSDTSSLSPQGFRALLADLRLQRGLQNLAAARLRDLVRQDPEQNLLLIDLQVPDQLVLRHSDDFGEWSLEAGRDFAAGETVFANTSLLFNANFYRIAYRLGLFDGLRTQSEIEAAVKDLEANSGIREQSFVIVLTENIEHSINRGGKLAEGAPDPCVRESYLFDSFMNHSCEPNLNSEYAHGESWTAEYFDKSQQPSDWLVQTSARVGDAEMRSIGLRHCYSQQSILEDCARGLSLVPYRCLARQPIQKGEQLTCDYYKIDSLLDETEFECQCGAASCRKVIKG